MTFLIRLILSAILICAVDHIQAQKTVFFGIRYEAPDGTWHKVSDSTFMIQTDDELQTVLQDLGVFSPKPAHRFEVSIEEEKGKGVPTWIRQRKENQQAFLGVEIESPDAGGARILEILDYPAIDAGLRVEDIIYRFDQVEIQSLADLPNQVRQCEPGSSHRIRYRRNGKNRKTTAILGSRKTISYKEDVVFTPVIQVKVYVRDRVEQEDESIAQLSNYQDHNPIDMRHCLIYPNPSSGKFTLDVELEESAPTEIVVLNPLGQILYREKLAEMQTCQKTFDLSQLSVGVYIIQIIQKDRMESRRILIEG